MHVSNFVVAAAAAASAGARAARKPDINADASEPGATESTTANRVAAPRECNAATASEREFTWLSKSLARIAAVWRRRSRTE
jgi:hypothetical protein